MQPRTDVFKSEHQNSRCKNLQKQADNRIEVGNCQHQGPPSSPPDWKAYPYKLTIALQGMWGRTRQREVRCEVRCYRKVDSTGCLGKGRVAGLTLYGQQRGRATAKSHHTCFTDTEKTQATQNTQTVANSRSPIENGQDLSPGFHDICELCYWDMIHKYR